MATLGAAAILAGACSSDTPASERLAEAIEERTGRPVTETELTSRIAQAERLCVLGDDLLGAVVTGRTAIELNIYDAYFDIWCPDRAEIYLAVRPGGAIGVGETPTTTTASTSSVGATTATTATTERAP
ncbi:MAG: hypothetical protein GY929_01025 [Actinomycetia bacterium]|nr:hypothetical protein [Actinomycetes bacterium]